jgi:hypothetical protein
VLTRDFFSFFSLNDGYCLEPFSVLLTLPHSMDLCTDFLLVLLGHFQKVCSVLKFSWIFFIFYFYLFFLFFFLLNIIFFAPIFFCLSLSPASFFSPLFFIVLPPFPGLLYGGLLLDFFHGCFSCLLNQFDNIFYGFLICMHNYSNVLKYIYMVLFLGCFLARDSKNFLLQV